MVLTTPACATKADWLERVQWAVANQDEVRLTAAELRERVLEERSIHREAASWRAVLATWVRPRRVRLISRPECAVRPAPHETSYRFSYPPDVISADFTAPRMA